MLSEAYGGETVKESSVFEWHKRFNERSGHPRSRRTDVNVEKVRKLMYPIVSGLSLVK
jgi:hypothetical protein